MPNSFSKLKFSLMLRAAGLWRQMTVGSRVAVIVEGKVLVVRHTYVGGWHLPGGGVSPGETAAQAGRREVLEETGFAIESKMNLVSLYHSTLYTDRDHVALFVVDRVSEQKAFNPGREIAEIAWLDINALPDDTSPATRRRLDEISGRAPISPKW